MNTYEITIDEAPFSAQGFKKYKGKTPEAAIISMLKKLPSTRWPEHVYVAEGKDRHKNGLPICVKRFKITKENH